ncbi:WD40 repeat domain-containing protein [Chelatococcus asaccharovorans]|uniref:WD-40 repeat-containing protein n=1 Tax=Chelatococcus asaccharovorans TaxID=28210 RepID=A0A2V3TYA0_9HYPH|nr:WD40 repeat domain-containing protein [Chelatococcus asaccharovorans]MBS7704601.1 WD40 repeat domain-containing protein [Chelatococcus asaccharovorans]PXW54502.1 WD-40 repeat-containing protein [Chelatococcus asaccharovorans]
MTLAPAPSQSLAEHVVAVEAGAHVIGLAWLGPKAAFALADGRVLLTDGREAARVAPHPGGGILVAARAGDTLITGGDDGRVVATAPDGTSAERGKEQGRWIDAVTGGRDGAIAWSAGKTVRTRDGKGQLRSFTAPTTAQGLAFMPKGYRLAIAHYNGVTLWFPNTDATPDVLAWKGSHLGVTVSPDGQYVVTAMQENSLHGWRLSDRKDMRMSGYPSKTRSLSWSHDGNWLATSGAEAAIIWPFDKQGPMGRAPRECGVRPVRVARVAFHPRALVLASAYEDGTVLLIRLTDASELLVQNATGASITALAWDDSGRSLAFGDEAGNGGLFTLPS